jgi:H+/Cl- antiporter ClcA
MPKTNLISVPLWKLALRLGAIFIFFLSFIKFFWNWIETGNLHFIKDAIESRQWIGFVLSMLIGGLIYGFTMGYYTKKQASKRQ